MRDSINQETFEEMMDREFNTLEIMLYGKGAWLAVTLDEFVGAARNQGMTKEAIRATLLEDLESGGRIFGEFRRSMKATAKGAVYRVRDNAEFASFGVITSYRWIAVLINTCPDCLARHGQVREWEEWEGAGLPRSGQTVCGSNCKCVLLPEETTEIEPIKREKKK